MLWFKFVLTFLIVIKLKYSLAEKKNACKHYYEYSILPLVHGTDCFYNRNVNSNMYKMVADNGYNLKTYNVTTPEGYILTLFRIFSKGSSRNNRQPIFMQHGVLIDSSIWIMTGKRSLAFSLVDQGYDVWLGNTRSTIHTKTNVNFPSKSLRYWDYSLDDLASDDLASSLKEVANITGKPGDIIYIAHSLGTTSISMYASQSPEEAHRLLKGIVMLSPIVYFTPNFFYRFIFDFGVIVLKLCKFFDIYVFLYDIKSIHPIIQLLATYFPLVFELANDLSSGRSKLFLPEDMLLLLSYFPDTVNVGTLNHVAQLYHTNQFQKYDYGSSDNKQLYDQNKPPLYDLSKITMPVYLFYGIRDAYIKPKSVQRLYNALGSTEKDIQIVPIGRNESDLQFAHNDLVLGKDIDTLFYPDLYRYLKRLKPS